MQSPSVGRYSLRFRVALTNVVTAALVGLAAAAAVTLLVGKLSIAKVDTRLRDIAFVLQEDIEHDPVPPEEAVRDEEREVLPLGVRLALFEGGTFRAGEKNVRDPGAEGCFSTTDPDGIARRTCAIGPPSRRIVSTARMGAEEDVFILFLSIAGAAALSAGLGALASRALAGWALAPLTVLNDHLERVSSDAPGTAELGAPSGASEVEALRETLRALLKRLGDALERSRGFAASAAHQLRTPLALLMGELELAAERAPAVAGELERSRATLSRLTRLVERLLALADDPAPLSSVREAVALEDVVRDVVGGCGESQRVRITTRFDAPGMVRGDEALLRVVVDNLVENALKFDPSGRIQVAVVEDGPSARLSVSDEGPGIDERDWDELLQPFRRGRTTEPGHGLGLAIVAHIVRTHQGALALVGRDKGTVIKVTLPLWTERTTSAN